MYCGGFSRVVAQRGVSRSDKLPLSVALAASHRRRPPLSGNWVNIEGRMSNGARPALRGKLASS